MCYSQYANVKSKEIILAYIYEILNVYPFIGDFLYFLHELQLEDTARLS